ncbi:hypothetical protein Y032_0004g1782 [Ancylostoma ceylanicum]|uniref:Uncharacterized protein n=1 Tax=Ancylostoma ceylanicum TaxID=53326 RepID=A0A016VTZ8_9BILA|nr:hypothetical protein Y032_0004g1782 [Ancylostoma ceylanicum]
MRARSRRGLDTLCNSIKERTDTQKQMQRFRALQRVITAYNRRSTKSVEQLLHTPLQAGVADDEPTSSTTKLDLSDKVLAQVPQFLAEEK